MKIFAILLAFLIIFKLFWSSIKDFIKKRNLEIKNKFKNLNKVVAQLQEESSNLQKKHEKAIYLERNWKQEADQKLNIQLEKINFKHANLIAILNNKFELEKKKIEKEEEKKWIDKFFFELKLNLRKKNEGISIKKYMKLEK